MSYLIPLYLLYAAVLLYVSWTDLRARRIPNAVLGPAALLALALTPWTIGLQTALLGALLAALPLVIARLLAGASGVGMGDIKLAIFIGLIVGHPLALGSITIALVLALAVGIAGAARGVYTRHSRLPFGPFLAAGTLPLLVVVALAG